METSSRNSEVVHAGIYYPRGSLKAQLCVQGKGLLRRYAQERGIAYQQTGKLVVAPSRAHLPRLRELLAVGTANGVTDLELLDERQCLQLEPHVAAVAGLLSPGTGVIDSHGLLTSLQADIEQGGGSLVLNARVRSGEVRRDGVYSLLVEDAVDGQLSTIQARWVVNSAGLHAHHVARTFANIRRGSVPHVWFAKGSYFTLAGRCPFSRLIYPMPEDGGLGAHLTLDLSAQAKFGPDVEWLSTSDAGDVDYDVQASRAAAFRESITSYWPGAPVHTLTPSYSGVRAKLSGPGMPPADFCVQTQAQHGLPGLVNLFGVESPGLTSSLALGEYVCGQVA